MLEVRQLHSRYGIAHVLQGVSVHVPRGRVVGLLGRNGMGKTSLIRSIMGFAQPRVTGGAIEYRGQSLLGLAPHAIARRGIGLVPQGRRLFASLTVAEHLTLTAPDPRARWNVPTIFELFPALAARRGHRGSQLSGGERQMLAIARALVLNPSLLLMDEPSEGLSPVMVRHLEGILLSLKAAGLSILLVEQNLNCALAVADDVSILENGRVVFHGIPKDLRADASTLRTFLGV